MIELFLGLGLGYMLYEYNVEGRSLNWLKLYALYLPAFLHKTFVHCLNCQSLAFSIMFCLILGIYNPIYILGIATIGLISYLKINEN